MVLELGGLVGRAAVCGGAHPHRGAAVGEDVLVGVLAEVDVAAVVALLADDLERGGDEKGYVVSFPVSTSKGMFKMSAPPSFFYCGILKMWYFQFATRRGMTNMFFPS